MAEHGVAELSVTMIFADDVRRWNVAQRAGVFLRSAPHAALPGSRLTEQEHGVPFR